MKKIIESMYNFVFHKQTYKVQKKNHRTLCQLINVLDKTKCTQIHCVHVCGNQQNLNIKSTFNGRKLIRTCNIHFLVFFFPAGLLLSVNDDLNNVFIRYDRYERFRQATSRQNEPSEAPPEPPRPAAVEPLPTETGRMTTAWPENEARVSNSCQGYDSQ